MTMIGQTIKARPENLHIQQSVDVTTVPAKAPELSIREIKQGSSAIVTYLETEFSMFMNGKFVAN